MPNRQTSLPRAATGSTSTIRSPRIGQMRGKELAKAKDDVAMDLMRSIKSALDPKGIPNPGKVL